MSATDGAKYNTKIYVEQGGDRLGVKSGGEIDIESGGALKFNGVDAAAVLAAAVAGVAAGYKVARGQHVQVAASDTVVTGLATVVAVVASFDTGPTVKQLHVAAGIGDQAGTPAAGSILLKTFKPTSSVNDATPTAATDFTDNLKINWIAVGT